MAIEPSFSIDSHFLYDYKLTHHVIDAFSLYFKWFIPLMNATFIAVLAIIAYAATTVLLIKPIIVSTHRKKTWLCGLLAVFLHAIYTVVVVRLNTGFNISFFSMASLVSLIVASLLLLAATTKPVENLGILLFPLTALMLGLEACLPEKQRSLDIHGWQMNMHILTSIIAFSLLNIAALQAILLTIQNQQLKSHPPKLYIQSMPPLESMESLLFQMIGAGLIFLSISLGSGFVFLDDLFGQHLAHKTFFSIAAWLVFSGLLIGRVRYGWRGRAAIKWTLLGFLFLLLAYFGSKLVMEVILHR